MANPRGAFWVVVRRELRVEARRPGHHWLRAGAAAVLGAACAWWWVDLPGTAGGNGLFRALGKTVLAGLWLLAPWLTADCLAREKREGTLGLLFLTPLGARDIVWGKAFLQSWRALVLVVATWPVLTVPLLLGGVGVPDVLRMLLLHLGALGLALAAGVAASALTERWWRARVLAVCFTAGSTVVYVGLHIALTAAWNSWSGRSVARGPSFGPEFRRLLEGWWQWQWIMVQFGPRSMAGGGTGGWFGVVQAAGVAAASAVLVWATGRLAARGLERTWRRAGEGRALPPWARWLTQPVAPSWAHGWKTRWLAWAPLVWLERRGWSARLGMVFWAGWAAIPLCVQVVFFRDWEFTAHWGGVWRWTLVVGMAIAAAGRMRDGDGGAWELLAVSPISRERLAAGLWLSVLSGFAPALAIVATTCGIAAWSAARSNADGSGWAAAALVGQSAMAIPPALAVVSLGIAGAMRGRRLLTGTWVSLATVGVAGAMAWWACVALAANLPRGWMPGTEVDVLGRWSVPRIGVWVADWACGATWLWIAWRGWRRTVARLRGLPAG
ncbi:MAG: hypothetical protein DVB31_07550 [Verrucomicrobia bacterium]|nr:MAG: hypothetical protein DVB31_07550 [Verrucomicrobiota bacterium]